MPYAKASGSGTSSQSQRFYNDKMVVCMSQGISYEALAHDLGRIGMWKSVTGFQRVDFN